MSSLPWLISSAQEWEKQGARREAERTLLPFWAIRKISDELKGRQTVDYSEFIEKALGLSDEVETAKKKPVKTEEELIAEFAPMIEAERRRLKGG